MAVALSLSPVHGTWGAAAQLPGNVRQALERHGVPEESLSLYVREFGAARPLLAAHTDVPRNPASVMKLLVTLAGLELLGPSYTWRTKFILNGKLQNGTLHGDLVIKGGGDPFLAKESFQHALSTLRARGLQHIEGDLLIDDGLFAKESGSPSDFDNRPYRAYNALPNATLLNFRSHQFYLVPQNTGMLVYADPPASNLHIENKLRLANGRCNGKHRQIRFRVSPAPNNTRVTLSGNYPKRCGVQLLLRTVLSNEDYLFGTFKSMWEGLGGTISGGAGKTNIARNKAFYTVVSKPMREIIAYVNKHSNNVMARQLLLTLGRGQTQAASSKASGASAIKAWLREQGIPAPELNIDNGSGLSREARVSTRTLAAVLEHARTGPYQPEFFASLALNGLDGTLKKRLGGIMPPGNARIKTGLLNNVRTMAGYVRSKSNRGFIVVAMHTHPGIQNRTGTLIQDELLRWVYAR